MPEPELPAVTASSRAFVVLEFALQHVVHSHTRTSSPYSVRFHTFTLLIDRNGIDIVERCFTPTTTAITAPHYEASHTTIPFAPSFRPSSTPSPPPSTCDIRPEPAVVGIELDARAAREHSGRFQCPHPICICLRIGRLRTGWVPDREGLTPNA